MTQPLAITSTADWVKRNEAGETVAVSKYPTRLRCIQTVERMERLLFEGKSYRLAKALHLPERQTVYKWKTGTPRISSRYAVDMLHLALDEIERLRIAND